MGRNTALLFNRPTTKGLQTRRATQERLVQLENMEKSIRFLKTAFGANVLRQAVLIMGERISNNGIRYSHLRMSLGDASWTYDEAEEFWADYPKSTGSVEFWVAGEGTSEYKMSVLVFGAGNARETFVSVTGPTRVDIETVFNIFEASREASKLPDEPVQSKGKIFIGHGGSTLWQDLHHHLANQQGYEVSAYEVGARAGHGVRDILEAMLDSSYMAFLIMTGEDETAEEQIRPRQNVVHELGLFQGRLGFPRGIAVVEEGIELFSNVYGIQQIRFSPGNLKEAYGDIVATIRREFGN